ncbi:enoyl-CoA hydratase [Caulobacter sp. Root656]|nr:enoyl-CoA hydratase [Caulobacter sp. Root656]
MTYSGKWLDQPEEILFEVSERVARITLNKPDKRNALSPRTLQELHDALLEADDRLDVNVVILQGAGKDFCAGYDLGGVYAGRKAEGEAAAADGPAYRSSSGSYDDDAWFMERQQDLTTVIFDLHKPVIARVQGNCLAGGTDLALMCDFVICSDDAKIGFPAARANGSPPNHMWIYHCGPQWAKRILMTGDSIRGRDAVTIGLALESAPADQLDAVVDELARRLSFVDNELLSAHKRIVNLALEGMGARTIQRLAAENDARAHLSKGPRRTQFKADMAEHGLKTALTNRDAPFGDGVIRLRED